MQINSADEQQLAVLGQCPKLIGHDKLQLVYLVADFPHLGLHRVVVGYRLLAFVRYLVRHLARVDEFLHARLDALRALGNLLNELHVARAELVGLLRGEYLAHVLHVLGQLALIVGGHGHDVVHRDVAHYARFYLDAFRVRVPFHFVARLQFLAAHHVHRLEHLHRVLRQVVVEDERTARLAVQSAPLGFFHPFKRIGLHVLMSSRSTLKMAAV